MHGNIRKIYETSQWSTLTLWSSVLLQRSPVAQPLKNFRALDRTRRFITAFHLSLSWAKPIQSTPPHPVSPWSILMGIIHPSTSYYSEEGSGKCGGRSLAVDATINQLLLLLIMLLLLLLRSWCSAVGIAKGYGAGRARNWGSIPGKCKMFTLFGPPSFVFNGYRRITPGP
jgi:hypothetical protein